MFVCICNQVRERDIVGAVEAGARSLDDLACHLAVATCCGKCADDAARVMHRTLRSDCADRAADLGFDAALA
ncbi:MAG: (2Fe-2S)-binding protein [Pseudomonadales bacterium]|jgi:bacterioferritin-associated ferredoxin|nr:(2Fe-2S)-binding protein [Pseudomonadales bacterium]